MNVIDNRPFMIRDTGVAPIAKEEAPSPPRPAEERRGTSLADLRARILAAKAEYYLRVGRETGWARFRRRLRRRIDRIMREAI
jgi:hypothetical protein